MKSLTIEKQAELLASVVRLEDEVRELREALEESKNALLDYITTIEKKGEASLNYGWSVVRLIDAALHTTSKTTGE